MTPHHHDHGACRQLFAKLSEYMDQEVDSATAREIRHHLDQCPPCQACLGTLERTVSLCAALERQTVPVSFSQRLVEMLEQAAGNDFSNQIDTQPQ